MADSDKNILITPQTSQTSDPTIEFKSGATSGDPITLSVSDDGTISTLDFSGSAGQLFSISNDLTGTLFAVSDSSGIPIIEADADGEVRLAEFGGLVGIGSSAPTHKLHLISDAFTGARLERNGSGGGIGVQFKNGDANIWELSHGGDEVFRFSYNGTDYATLTNTGVLTASSFSGTVSASNLSGDLPSGVDPYITATSTDASYRMVFRDAADASGNSQLFNDSAASFYYNPSTNVLTVPTVSGSLSGTATNATNINVAADNTTNEDHYVIFTSGPSGNRRPNSDDTFRYNPSSNTLTATTFAGTATGANNVRVDADNTTNAAHYLTFVGSAGSGSTQRLNTDTGLTYNPSSGLLDMQDGSRLGVNRIDTANGQHLVLNAGESGAYANSQTNEFVYINAESGLQITSSPDNWDANNGGASAWANRNTAVVINASDGSSTFNDVIVSGNLTVNGATVTNSATNTTIEDALIELGSGNTGTNSNDLGLILERGTTGDNVFIGWDESADKVRIATTTNTGAATGGLTLTDADFQAGNISARTVVLQNLEKSNLNTDGQLGFDSSQGLIVYRTQQGTSGAATAVLDGWNVAAGTYISITNLGAGGTGTEEFTFSHNNTTRSDTTSTANPGYGTTFTAIDSVTTNTQGHVTAVNTKTISIPASDNTNSIDYINSASFNTGNGIITLSGVGNAGATVDIDGRYVETTPTRLGLTSHSLVSFTAVGDYDKPAGYQTMMRGTNTAASVVGTPVAANYWLYNVMAKRDTAGGTAALLQNYDNGDFYVGFTAANTTAPTWRRTYLDTDFTANGTGPNTATTTSSRTYLVQRNSSDNTQLVVNVPWTDNNTTNFNVQANGGTQVNISAGEEVNFINGTLTTAAVTNQANPTVTFNHNSVSRTNNTSTAQPGYGGTFTAIDSITTSTQGHVTAVNTKTVTIPSSDNTNTTYSISAVDDTPDTDGAALRLTAGGSGSGTDDVEFQGSTDIRFNSSGAGAIKAFHQSASVGNAILANMAANTVKVRDANSSGQPTNKTVGNTQLLIGNGAGFTAASLSGDVSMTNAGVVTVANDSHSHDTQYIPLTGSSSITGALSTTGTSIEVGRGSGSVAMTTNDGDGNANLTFNHKNGDADFAGNVARIEVNTDSTTGAAMQFELSNNNATGAITINNTGMTLNPGVLTINNNGSGGGQLVAGDLTLTALSAQNSEATALMINGSNIVGTRELASGAFAAAYSHPNHSGDVTSSGDGATTIANDAVTYAKMQNVATANRVLGSTSAGGVISEVQVITQMIAADAVTYGKIQNLGTANRLLGGITAGGPISEVRVATPMIEPDAVTFPKIENIATNTILGRVSASSGDIEELTPAQVRTMINVADGAQVNVGTDITVFEGTATVEIQSSTGSNDSIVGASATNAGVVTTGTQVFAGTKSFSSQATFSQGISVVGNILPSVDNSQVVGNASFTFNNGRFTNFQVDSTLTVRGAIDLADNDDIRLGTGDDYIIDFNSQHLVIHQNVSSANDVYITNTNDDVEFWFDVSTGNFHADGDVIANSTSTASDLKFKKNIATIDNAVDKVKQLRGVTFDWKKDNTTSAGVIAQEIEEVLPYAVTEKEERTGIVDNGQEYDTYKAVNYNTLHAVLIEAIKEQQEQIEALKAQIEDLKK